MYLQIPPVTWLALPSLAMRDGTQRFYFCSRVVPTSKADTLMYLEARNISMKTPHFILFVLFATDLLQPLVGGGRQRCMPLRKRARRESRRLAKRSRQSTHVRLRRPTSPVPGLYGTARFLQVPWVCSVLPLDVMKFSRNVLLDVFPPHYMGGQCPVMFLLYGTTD